jgi:hypothetical protein
VDDKELAFNLNANPTRSTIPYQLLDQVLVDGHIVWRNHDLYSSDRTPMNPGYTDMAFAEGHVKLYTQKSDPLEELVGLIMPRLPLYHER